MPRLAPAGPSITEQAQAGSKAAQAVVDEVELGVNYMANVVERMRTVVLHGVEVELDGPDDPEGTGLRNLTEEDAGAIIGVLRTLNVTLANVDMAVARIIGQRAIGATPSGEWPVHL